jgi:hypothetical protein
MVGVALQQRSIPADGSPPRPSNLWIAFFFVIGAILFWLTNHDRTWASWMEDLPVYKRAVNDWLAGHSPYDGSMAPLYFLYPPAFLLIAGWLSHLFPAHWGPAAYLLLDFAALIAIPLVLARYYFRQSWLTPLFALLLFFASPRFTGIRAMRTMNIASALYCLAFVAAIPGLRRNRWHWFYVAVFLAASVKITFLALLLLPLLAGKRQWLRSILCGAAVVLANLGERIFWPDLYRGYTQSLQQGILNRQAFGYGIFGVIANYHFQQKGVGVAAYAVSVLLALTLTGLLFWTRLRLERAGNALSDLASNAIWLAMILIGIVLVNPRELQYDIDISVFAALILCAVALRIKRLPALTLLIIVLFLPSQLTPHVVVNPRLHGIYETLLSFAAFALGYWRLNRESKLERVTTQLAPA